mmetsp:Transcript_7852/g.17812  ORF Transcript_7852/g.17812 Transcript_7852/m.17812 type:complete len:416 (+) Transcript_7852:3-1250(+)
MVPMTSQTCPTWKAAFGGGGGNTLPSCSSMSFTPRSPKSFWSASPKTAPAKPCSASNGRSKGSVGSSSAFAGFGSSERVAESSCFSADSGVSDDSRPARALSFSGTSLLSLSPAASGFAGASSSFAGSGASAFVCVEKAPPRAAEKAPPRLFEAPGLGASPPSALPSAAPGASVVSFAWSLSRCRSRSICASAPFAALAFKASASSRACCLACLVASISALTASASSERSACGARVRGNRDASKPLICPLRRSTSSADRRISESCASLSSSISARSACISLGVAAAFSRALSLSSSLSFLRSSSCALKAATSPVEPSFASWIFAFSSRTSLHACSFCARRSLISARRGSSSPDLDFKPLNSACRLASFSRSPSTSWSCSEVSASWSSTNLAVTNLLKPEASMRLAGARPRCHQSA